jgi:hypothetical protein
VTVSVPELAVKARVDESPDVTPQVAVIVVVATVSWMCSATNVASAAGHCQVPAALSWNPRKCSTRQVATASVGDHDVPAAATATWLSRLGTASLSVSALANSWATSARVGEPAKTVFSDPDAQDVQPVAVPDPAMTPHCAEVSPAVQVQFEPGSIPAVSTCATKEAVDGDDAG